MKINKLLIIMVFLLSISCVYAGNTYNIDFKDELGNDISSFDYEVFICSEFDNLCNTVESDYYKSGTNVPIATFESKGQSELANYAIYFYKDGYLPKKGAITGDIGSGDSNSGTFVFNKKDLCIAPIVNFSVTNEVYSNRPIEIFATAKLDAQTASAFELANFMPNYKPQSWFNKYASLFSATTLVDVEVYKDGTYIETLNSPSKEIFADEIESFNFTYIPQTVGVYTFVFNSYIDDNQCKATQIVTAVDESTVIEENKLNYAYSLLKDLTYSPAHPKQGETIYAGVDFVSNFVNANNELVPVATRITYTLYKAYNSTSGVIEDSLSRTYVTNTISYTKLNFELRPKTNGWYTMEVKAEPLDGAERISKRLYTTFYVSESAVYDYTLNIVNENGTKLNNVFAQLDNSFTTYSNVEGIVYFNDLNPGFYEYKLSLTEYEDYFGNFYLYNSDSFGVATMIYCGANCNNSNNNTNGNNTNGNNTNGNNTGPVKPIVSKYSFVKIDLIKSNIDYFTKEDLEEFLISFNNIGTKDVDSATITVSIPELGAWDKVSNIDIDKGDRYSHYFNLDLPNKYASGWYDLRVQVDGINYNRAKWYDFYLE